MYKTVKILVGKPGSGKSTYVENKLKEHKRNYKIDADDGSFNTLVELTEYIKKTLKTIVPVNGVLYVDGLFLTNKIHEKLYNELNSNFINVIFVIFRGNDDTLLYNDKLRVQNGERSKDCSINIKNSVIETDFINSIKRKQTYSTEEIYVKKYDYLGSLEERIKLELGITDEISSETWTTGGTYGTCWDEDGPTVVEPEAPVYIFDTYEFYSFTILVKYLHKNENLTIDEISDKYGACYGDIMGINETYDHDYYGGSQTFENWHTSLHDVLEVYFKEVHGVHEYDSEYIELNHPELMI